jgi:hypothetical protein
LTSYFCTWCLKVIKNFASLNNCFNSIPQSLSTSLAIHDFEKVTFIWSLVSNVYAKGKFKTLIRIENACKESDEIARHSLESQCALTPGLNLARLKQQGQRAAPEDPEFPGMKYQSEIVNFTQSVSSLSERNQKLVSIWYITKSTRFRWSLFLFFVGFPIFYVIEK